MMCLFKIVSILWRFNTIYKQLKELFFIINSFEKYLFRKIILKRVINVIGDFRMFFTNYLPIILFEGRIQLFLLGVV